MDEDKKPRVVISHANIETKLAGKIKEFLVNTLTGVSQNDVWYSDEPRALDYDEAFFGQIVNKIKECEIVISIQSPISKARPWPLWESGMAHGLGKGPYVFTFAAEESIRGRLGTPLDYQHQCDGTDSKSVDAIIDKISKKLKDDLNPEHMKLAEKFVADTAELVSLTRDAEVEFDRHLIIVATDAEFQEIVQNGVIPEGVTIIGDDHTFRAFGYPLPKGKSEIGWGMFFQFLKEQELPWPNSATRWANALVQVLQKAKDNRLIQEAEALPLYYSPVLRKSLRPALTKRSFRGSKLEFEVTFVDLPLELVERPAGDLGILFHYLDLGRMFRWGVLESEGVIDLRTKPTIPTLELESSIKKILLKIFNIRTDFLNRGLQKDSLLQAVDQNDSSLIIELMRQYNVLIEKLDPLDGMLAKELPDRSALLSYLDEMLAVNKGFMEIVVANIDAKIKKLPSHFAGMSKA